MKITKFETEEEWLEGRLGRITGSRAGALIGKRDLKPKKGYYELIAERVAIPSNGENPMDRGHRIESEAIERFCKATKKKVNTDLVIWHRDEDDSIAISPDGYIEKKVKGVKKIVGGVECKCLNSASHIEAWLTKEIPSEYQDQVTQYFVVNDDLETLFFVFYDPRMPIDLFWIEIRREDRLVEIHASLEMERKVLAEVAAIEAQLTF